MAESDVLVTDYSCLMFEFAIMKKPVFLYCNDLGQYRNDRSFYFNLNKLPFKVNESINALHSAIIDVKEVEYVREIETFFETLKLCEYGNASEEVVNLITGILEKSNTYENAPK